MQPQSCLWTARQLQHGGLTPCLSRQAGCDLTSVPRKSLLRLLAEHCGDASDRRALLHLSSRDGRADYAAQVVREQPSLLDLLRRSDTLPPSAALYKDASFLHLHIRL